MWLSPHENLARGAEVLFYLAARGSAPLPPNSIWGCPGDRFFVKNRASAHVRVTTAHGGAQSHTKSSPRPPRSPKWSPKAHFYGGPGHPFGRKFAIVAPCENPCIYYVLSTFTRLGAVRFRISNCRGDAVGSRSVFFSLLVALGAQKCYRRAPKCAQCAPNASKSPPGDLQRT